MGYIYALLSSLFFTLYALPKKKAKLSSYYYVFFMGTSCFVISIIFYFVFGKKELMFNNWLLLSFLGGIIWFIASSLFFYSVDKMGVAMASEFKSLQGPIGSILILTILSEFTSLNIYLLILAIIFIFLAAIMLVINEDEKKATKPKNILIILLSAFLYGINGFLRKVVTLKGFVYSQQIYSSLGILVIATIYMIIKDKKMVFHKESIRKYYLASLSGVFYYLASFFMLVAYKHVSGAIAFTIIQLNSIWSCLIGIFIFKEIDYTKHCKRLILGLLLAITGISLLILCN